MQQATAPAFSATGTLAGACAWAGAPAAGGLPDYQLQQLMQMQQQQQLQQQQLQLQMQQGQFQQPQLGWAAGSNPMGLTMAGGVPGLSGGCGMLGGCATLGGGCGAVAGGCGAMIGSCLGACGALTGGGFAGLGGYAGLGGCAGLGGYAGLGAGCGALGGGCAGLGGCAWLGLFRSWHSCLPKWRMRCSGLQCWRGHKWADGLLCYGCIRCSWIRQCS